MKRESEEIPHTFPDRLRQAVEADLADARRQGFAGCRVSWFRGYQAGYSEGLRAGLRLSEERGGQ